MTLITSTTDPKPNQQTLPVYSVEPDAQHQQQNEKVEPEFSPSNGKLHKLNHMAGRPLNKAANLIGAEGWWPSALEKECNKAARILHSFTELSSSVPKENAPVHPTGLTRKAMVKIPPAVLQHAAGLAIFNVLRAGGGHASLAGGSGVVISRRPDGTWSPPSAFIVTTIGGGLVFGLDVYDCVCVLNTPEQVNAFTKPRVSLGAEGSITVGPLGTGSSVETALSKTIKPIWTYMKSRGLWAGIQIDGTIMISRDAANAAFYQKPGVTARQIFDGQVSWPAGGNALLQVLNDLQGQTDFERTVINDLADIPGTHESYTDVPRTMDMHNGEAQNVAGGVPYESGLPPYKDVEQAGNGENVLDEKDNLAKSGY